MKMLGNVSQIFEVSKLCGKYHYWKEHWTLKFCTLVYTLYRFIKQQFAIWKHRVSRLGNSGIKNGKKMLGIPGMRITFEM